MKGIIKMAWFHEHIEMDDPLDSPKYEVERKLELEKYWQELDDRERWSE